MERKLNLDTFGEMMDNFIKKNKIQMLITLPEGETTVEVKDNYEIGSVLQFYIILNAIPSVAEKIKAEMGIEKAGWEDVVDVLLELIKRNLLEVGAE